MNLHTVTFHPPDDSWLGTARHHDLRTTLAQMAIDAIGGGDEPSLVVFPAGFLHAHSLALRDQLAEALRASSRRAEVSLVFGIDVGPENVWAPLAGPPESFAYVCEEGEPLLWPAVQLRAPSVPDRDT